MSHLDSYDAEPAPKWLFIAPVVWISTIGWVAYLLQLHMTSGANPHLLWPLILLLIVLVISTGSAYEESSTDGDDERLKRMSGILFSTLAFGALWVSLAYWLFHWVDDQSTDYDFGKLLNTIVFCATVIGVGISLLCSLTFSSGDTDRVDFALIVTGIVMGVFLICLALPLAEISAWVAGQWAFGLAIIYWLAASIGSIFERFRHISRLLPELREERARRAARKKQKADSEQRQRSRETLQAIQEEEQRLLRLQERQAVLAAEEKQRIDEQQRRDDEEKKRAARHAWEMTEDGQAFLAKEDQLKREKERLKESHEIAAKIRKDTEAVGVALRRLAGERQQFDKEKKQFADEQEQTINEHRKLVDAANAELAAVRDDLQAEKMHLAAQRESLRIGLEKLIASTQMKLQSVDAAIELLKKSNLDGGLVEEELTRLEAQRVDLLNEIGRFTRSLAEVS